MADEVTDCKMISSCTSFVELASMVNFEMEKASCEELSNARRAFLSSGLPFNLLIPEADVN